MKIVCVILSLFIFLNPLVQPLITYHMPELLPVVEPVNKPFEKPIAQPIVQPVIRPLNSCVICPALTQSRGENTISLIGRNQISSAFSVICLQ